jgi:DNA-binding GntR family transcriptional regulator
LKKQCLITKRIADDLEVPQGQPVYVFKGIRHMINSKSRASYKAYTSELIGREISIKPIESQLLYLEVEKISREPIMSAKQFIYATLADGKNAEEMGVQPGSPVLVAKRIFRSETESPLLVTFNYFPGESTQSVSVIERQ